MMTIYAGKSIKLKAGTFVKRDGKLTKRINDTIVTVSRTEQARNGKTRIYWKSNGRLASALIG